MPVGVPVVVEETVDEMTWPVSLPKAVDAWVVLRVTVVGVVAMVLAELRPVEVRKLASPE